MSADEQRRNITVCSCCIIIAESQSHLNAEAPGKSYALLHVAHEFLAVLQAGVVEEGRPDLAADILGIKNQEIKINSS